MKLDTQLQDDVQAVETRDFVQKCRSCGWPIRDCGTPAYLDWCDSMHRLLILKTVQPEQCHRSCFIAALMAETASEPDGSSRNMALRRSTKFEFARRRQHAAVPAAAMASCAGA